MEELGKAALEVTSGAVACFPGVGTAASIGIDAALIGWDVGDAYYDDHSAEGHDKADAPMAILLKRKVFEISITNGTPSRHFSMTFSRLLLPI